MVSLNKNPAVKANTPDKPTAGTISIWLNFLIRITTVVKAIGMIKAYAFPRAVPPEILVPIMTYKPAAAKIIATKVEKLIFSFKKK